MTSPADGARHLNELKIASYLDRGLSDVDRTSVEDHLVDCSECRRNVAEAERFLASFRRSRRTVVLSTFGGLIAVAAAALFVVRPQLARENPVGSRITRDATEAIGLAVYEPLGRIAAYPVQFIWASAPGAITYRITLSTADGTTLWSANVTDTTATLPRRVTLQPGGNYVWFADAIFGDGSTRSTGLRQVEASRVTK